VQITQRTACLHFQRSMLSKPIQPHNFPACKNTFSSGIFSKKTDKVTLPIAGEIKRDGAKDAREDFGFPFWCRTVKFSHKKLLRWYLLKAISVSSKHLACMRWSFMGQECLNSILKFVTLKRNAAYLELTSIFISPRVLAPSRLIASFN
jgi:hypothetical protein